MLTEYDGKYTDECVAAYMDTFMAEPFGYFWLTEESTRRYFTDMERSPRFLGYVFVEDGRAKGVCLGTLDDYFRGVFYEIKEIFVERGSQGQGLGTLFLAEIEEDLRAKGVSCVTLLTQRDIRAFDFYVKNGFIESDGATLLAKVIN